MPAVTADFRRIFCVEDDPVAQRVVIAALARRGWIIECACDGQDALDRYAADARGFDVIVTDHRMPRLDGLTLIRRLRVGGFQGAVVVVSAGLTAGDREAYDALGVAAILLKPIRAPELREAVAIAAQGLEQSGLAAC